MTGEFKRIITVLRSSCGRYWLGYVITIIYPFQAATEVPVRHAHLRPDPDDQARGQLQVLVNLGGRGRHIGDNAAAIATSRKTDGFFGGLFERLDSKCST